MFTVDFVEYHSMGKTLLFLSPYQHLKWVSSGVETVLAVRFHGDFYCIEYHKKEVACNGILFNNIYQQPFVSVTDEIFDETGTIINKISAFIGSENQYDTSIAKTYLQLILALSSKEKQIAPEHTTNLLKYEDVIDFQNVLDAHFRETKDVAFYADKFGLAANTFTKKIKRNFGKAPSKLIQERIVLEAKKLLHLTYKPIKEIAADLNFEDEFYFSRYFKKEVGVSPSQFRERVGISVVAEKSR